MVAPVAAQPPLLRHARHVGCFRTARKPQRAGAAAAQRRSSHTRCMLTPEAVFGAATLLAMPVYGLLAAAPRRRLTQQVASSPLLYAAAAAAYGAALLHWQLLPRIGAALRAAALTGGWPDVAAFGGLFASPAATALAWVHLLALDLYQARWVHRDGLATGTPTAHSAVLCFMVGPLGLLSHWLTKQVVARLRRGGGPGQLAGT